LDLGENVRKSLGILGRARNCIAPSTVYFLSSSKCEDIFVLAMKGLRGGIGLYLLSLLSRAFDDVE